ncbi:MAG: penicillin-binding protein activator [Gammaproteobacteria bacterium]
MKGVIVNLENKEIEKSNVLNVRRTKDFIDILSFARNKNKSSLIMSDKPKGQESFIESTWKDLGGNVIFSNKQEGTNRSLSELLLLESSKERKRRLSRSLSTPLESTPRRRNDLDSLIISSSISKARSLKPELDYNFGESLAVYFIPEWDNNEVYSKRELDLNDIYLVDMPWMFNTQSYVSERNSLKRNRNFALGFDSLETLLLKLNPSSSNKFVYKGLSGQITYQKGNLKRKSLKVQVKEGDFEFIDY